MYRMSSSDTAYVRFTTMRSDALKMARTANTMNIIVADALM